MKIIEQEIWDYLDGNLSQTERKLVELRIHSDIEYRSLFEEFKFLQDSMQALELDQPSMSFNRNVMEQVALEPAPGLIKSLIDKRIIYGISAFFILTITGLLIYLFASVDWSSFPEATKNAITLPELNYSALLDKTFIRAFLFIDIVLGMLLADGFLRKHMNSKKLKNI